jgi:hypothetical protein
MEYCNVFTKDALLAKHWQNETKGTSYTTDKQYLIDWLITVGSSPYGTSTPRLYW